MKQKDLPELQPIKQALIWERVKPGDGPDKLKLAVDELSKERHDFHVDGGSWTNNISWVRGYEDVLGPMEKVSALFNEKILRNGVPPSDSRYRRALFYMMASQTSCYRYWGQGIWTDYGKEISRRAHELLTHEL